MKYSYQRLRKPLREEFELELKKRIEDILITNYKKDNTTTRFDFDIIKNISKDILRENNYEGLRPEDLFPAWLGHFANRNKSIKRFIVKQRTFLGKLAE